MHNNGLPKPTSGGALGTWESKRTDLGIVAETHTGRPKDRDTPTGSRILGPLAYNSEFRRPHVQARYYLMDYLWLQFFVHLG
jgi:hypothetical protein